jgi:NAD(P)-dependent dehydrogenase (short-subunit alcohol dehydrogenase family)
METFRKKVSIVTGGGPGIGKALCIELCGKGSVVIVVDINAEYAQETANAIGQLGDRHTPNM